MMTQYCTPSSNLSCDAVIVLNNKKKKKYAYRPEKGERIVFTQKMSL